MNETIAARPCRLPFLVKLIVALIEDRRWRRVINGSETFLAHNGSREAPLNMQSAHYGPRCRHRPLQHATILPLVGAATAERC